MINVYRYIDCYTIIAAPRFIEYDNVQYINPSQEILAVLGYKELIENERPEGDSIPYYTDGANITNQWELIIPSQDDMLDFPSAVAQRQDNERETI